MAMYFYFSLSTRTFKVILICVVQFDNMLYLGQKHQPSAILDIQNIHYVTTGKNSFLKRSN